MKRTFLVVAALSLVLYACGGDDAHPDVTAARDAASVAAGGDVFAANCAVCHGADLSGGSGPNLITSELSHPDSDFVDAITNGKDEMPAFDLTLSAEEIAQVVDFVRSAQAAGLEE
ncbi:MAG: cytochrome c [Acidimicrobiia bacterium]|nr:cytochrome c [Acidimicrobiia bacterium]MDH3471681.1 cytochrome c [Acidimicrobiia bacterium]